MHCLSKVLLWKKLYRDPGLSTLRSCLASSCCRMQDDNWVVNIDSEALQDSPSLLPGFFVLEHGVLTMVLQDYWRNPWGHYGSLESDTFAIDFWFKGIISFVLQSNLRYGIHNELLSTVFNNLVNISLITLRFTLISALFAPLLIKSCNLLYLLVCLLSARRPNTNPDIQENDKIMMMYCVPSTLQNAAFPASIDSSDKVNICIWRPLKRSMAHEVGEDNILDDPTHGTVLHPRHLDPTFSTAGSCSLRSHHRDCCVVI